MTPPPFRSICVFCGSSSGNDPRFMEAASLVGSTLARRGIALVYGGGRVGLMGACADAALAAGGRVLGFIPRAMVEAERGHTGLTQLTVVSTMHERKALMADASDAFLALPGGYGTFDELFEAITWTQIGVHTKPIGLLNVAGFYNGLNTFLDHVAANGFIQPRFRAALLSDANLDPLLGRMAAFEPIRGTGFARPVDR